ncbi:MAG TPA: mucoidy inhibitor MuiA family protein [Candidatus Polarisedimenticolia bacterium]|nr:mucoidy inhibitor MuiA family protein [Candidatus Polarisedimenticolia bacterium]
MGTPVTWWRFWLVLLVLLGPEAAAASDFSPASKVVGVTVFRDGALVAREARVTLPPGDHRVVLKEIPSVADPDSVRVNGSGTGGMTLGGVEITRDFRPPQLTPEYKLLERDLEELTIQMVSLDDRQRSISSLREFLASLKSTAGQESSKDLLSRGFAVDSWQKAFQFLSERLDGLAAQERALAPKRKELSEKVEVTRQKLGQLASQGGMQRWNATVLVSAAHGGELTLTATYLAQGASWNPLYDARLDSTTGDVEMICQAQVTQSTGEDWESVHLTLSTTRPAAGIDLPNLASLQLVPAPILAARMEKDREGFVDGASSGRADEMDVITAGAGDEYRAAQGGFVGISKSQAAPAPAEMPEAGVERRDVAVTFDLPGKLDIPSDAQPHKHRVASRELKGDTEYRSTPRLNRAIFLVSRVRLAGEVPLLPGRVQHFVGPDLVGASWMADRAPGEEFPLSFGPDDRIKAERKSIWRKVEHKGRDDEIDYKFLTILENHLGRDATIELKDRIPVSGDERITVTLDEKETTSAFRRDANEPGILTWNVTVSKEAKKEVVLRYRVRKPRELLVAGME